MTRLLNAEIDLLAVAAEAEGGAPLPAPAALENTVARLLARGFLRSEQGTVKITPAGRAALAENAGRIFEWSEPDGS